MSPLDLEYLVTYIVGLVGSIVSAIGAAFSAGTTTPGQMTMLTTGIFGENGGLIYWLNQKIVWLVDQVLAGLTFTTPLT